MMGWGRAYSKKNCGVESDVSAFAAAGSDRRIIGEMGQVDLFELLLLANAYVVDVVELFGGSAGGA